MPKEALCCCEHAAVACYIWSWARLCFMIMVNHSVHIPTSSLAFEYAVCRELADDPLQPISYTGEGPGGSTYCVNMSSIMRQIRLLVRCFT